MQQKGWACVIGVIASVSCGGGRMNVGMEEGSGGTNMTSEAGATGDEPAPGKGGETGSGAGTGGTGGTGEAAGAGGAENPVGPRCGFSPDAVDPASAPFADRVTVESRITLFIEDIVLDTQDPAEADPIWASTYAISLLDSASAQDSAPDGLSRFLETWLGVPSDAAEPYAEVWSAKLVAPDATLATLLAEPTADPERIGILTDQQLLAARQGITTRGVWLYRSLFCGDVPPVPAGIPALEPPLPGETRRQTLARNVAPASCAGCHEITDPPGWALENFDDAGDYRTTDNGQPVDSSGTLQTPGGTELSYESIGDLAPQLAQSCEVAQCFTRALMNHAFAVTDPNAALPYSESELNHVANRFADSDFSLRELVKAIVETPSFLE